MATKDTTDALVALESFVGRVGDQDVIVRQGDLFRASDPAVKKWPEKFGPVAYRDQPIERATAAPGEKRGA